MGDPDRHKSDRHETVGAGSDKYKIRALEEKLKAQEERDDEHSKRLDDLEKQMAKGSNTFTEIKLEMKYMLDGLKGVQGVLARLNWTIILAVVGGLLALVLKKGG